MISNKQKKVIDSKWSFKSLKENELQNILMDIKNDKIFTSYHLTYVEKLICFRNLIYFKPNEPRKPRKPHPFQYNQKVKRENNLYEVLKKDEEEKSYLIGLELYKYEMEVFESNYNDNFGLIYEYVTKKVKSLSGELLVFDTFRVLNKKDLEKVKNLLNK